MSPVYTGMRGGDRARKSVHREMRVSARSAPEGAGARLALPSRSFSDDLFIGGFPPCEHSTAYYRVSPSSTWSGKGSQGPILRFPYGDGGSSPRYRLLLLAYARRVPRQPGKPGQPQNSPCCEVRQTITWPHLWQMGGTRLGAATTALVERHVIPQAQRHVIPHPSSSDISSFSHLL